MILSDFKIIHTQQYEAVCAKRAEAGSKGGKQKVANQANATNCKQKVANQADNNNDNNNDNNRASLNLKPPSVGILYTPSSDNR